MSLFGFFLFCIVCFWHWHFCFVALWQHFISPLLPPTLFKSPSPHPLSQDEPKVGPRGWEPTASHLHLGGAWMQDLLQPLRHPHSQAQGAELHTSRLCQMPEKDCRDWRVVSEHHQLPILPPWDPRPRWGDLAPEGWQQHPGHPCLPGPGQEKRLGHPRGSAPHPQQPERGWWWRGGPVAQLLRLPGDHHHGGAGRVAVVGHHEHAQYGASVPPAQPGLVALPPAHPEVPYVDIAHHPPLPHWLPLSDLLQLAAAGHLPANDPAAHARRDSGQPGALHAGPVRLLRLLPVPVPRDHGGHCYIAGRPIHLSGSRLVSVGVTHSKTCKDLSQITDAYLAPSLPYSLPSAPILLIQSIPALNRKFFIIHFVCRAIHSGLWQSWVSLWKDNHY